MEQKCTCETPTFQKGPVSGLLVCDECWGFYQGNPEPIPRKEVISIQPGDVIIMKCKDKLSDDSYSNMQSALSRLYPDNKCSVLDNGMTLEVYREQEKEPQEPEIDYPVAL